MGPESAALNDGSQTEEEKHCTTPLTCAVKTDKPFIGSTDAEAEAPILWPLDVKDQLTGKDPDAGKD